MPYALIAEIVRARMTEVREKQAAKRERKPGG